MNSFTRQFFFLLFLAEVCKKEPSALNGNAKAEPCKYTSEYRM